MWGKYLKILLFVELNAYIMGQARSLKIGVIQSEPFLRENDGRFEGFIVDLVGELSKSNNFSYDLLSSVDNRYGVETFSGTWNGLVGMLLRNEIDCIAADLTVTAQRMTVMDFTKPFMSSSITLLLKDSVNTKYNPISWFQTYSAGVWILLFIFYLLASSALFFTSRVSSKESISVSYLECLWYLASCWFRGSSYKPACHSTRLLSVGWWMFLVTSLALQLVLLPGHLTSDMWPVTRRYTSVSQVLDNVDSVGVVRAGSTLQMLERSANPVHQSLLTRLSHVDNYIAGLDMVTKQEESVAMLMEETAAQYIVAQDCDMYTVGRLEDRYYSLAFRKGSALTQTISSSILDLSESGTLSMIRDKWWPAGVECPPVISPSPGSPVTLTVHHMATPFIIMAAVIVISILIAIIEIQQDSSISSLPKYIRQKLSAPKPTSYICDYVPRVQKHEATQTILWASSRASTPGPTGKSQV